MRDIIKNYLRWLYNINHLCKEQEKTVDYYVDNIGSHPRQESEVLTNTKKTPIQEWFANLNSCPNRHLANLLLNNRHADTDRPFEYVEDVNRFDFLRLRGAGEKAWKSFKELRGY